MTLTDLMVAYSFASEKIMEIVEVHVAIEPILKMTAMMRLFELDVACLIMVVEIFFNES